MKHLLLALATLTILAISAPLAQAAPACQFVLGFATLHALDATDIGDCVDNQGYAPNGDAQQHTTTGLMAWRKADNWTAFTNGYKTWINGPDGLVSRLNTDRFPWEAASAPTPITTAPCSPGVPPFTGLEACGASGGTDFKDGGGNLVFQISAEDISAALHQLTTHTDPSGIATVGCGWNGSSPKFTWRCTYDPSVAGAALKVTPPSNGPDISIWQHPSGELLLQHYPATQSVCVTAAGLAFLSIGSTTPGCLADPGFGSA